MSNQSEPLTYNIQISEYQRKIIYQVLQGSLMRDDMVAFMKTQPGDTSAVIPGADMLEEVQTMVGMLNDLPRHEENHPGITHGLYL